MVAKAWAHERPHKKPGSLADEAGWRQELTDADYDAETLTRAAIPVPRSLDDLSVQQIAIQALDRCAAGASTWTVHTIQEQVTRITTEAGVHTAGWFGRRRVDRENRTTRQKTEMVRARLLTHWGNVSDNAEGPNDWAARAAAQRAATDPHVTDADHAVANANAARESVIQQHRRKNLALLARLYGLVKVRRDPIHHESSRPHREAAKWHARPDKARTEATRLRALSVEEAAQRITAKHAATEAARQAATDRPRRSQTSNEHPSRNRRHDEPGLGF